MRFNYKIIPVDQPHPAFPRVTSNWVPILPVRLSSGHSRQTPRLEAIVDSGAADCLFQASIAAYLGLRLERGIKGTAAGIAAGVRIDVYYHDINLWVGADMIRITAGFASALPVAALLGRHGFFENFIITFDPSASPPGFEIQRVGRA